MIHIVDYGLGNVQAFANMYKRLGIPTKLAAMEADLEGAQRIILPGVGAFDHAVHMLNSSGMRPTLQRLVIEDCVPTLGVCVGMQLLADGSDEGDLPGLGWIPGRVRSFDSHPVCSALPQPHMGWNDVVPKRVSPILTGLDADIRFYFLHSYYFECVDADHSLAESYYGINFSSVVNKGNVFGVQCHPEKSHHWGATLLKNFWEMKSA